MKRGYLLICLLLVLITLAFKHQKKDNTYQVVYIYCAAVPNNVAVADSIEMVMINGNGDTSRSKVPNRLNPSLFEINFQITVIGNNDSSIITVNKRNVSADISVNVNTPEKLIFRKNKWYTYKNNKVMEMPEILHSYSATDTYKIISGYKCRKYMVKELERNQAFEVWLTKELPSTLMPGAGYKPFPGAVLEMYFPDGEARFKVHSITKL